MPRARARSARGEASVLSPRPLGLSGRVTSASTGWRLARTRSRPGVANGGEPRKTSRTSEMRRDRRLELLVGELADQLFRHLAVLDHEERRDGVDPVARGDL